MIENYLLHILILICIYLILALSYNLALGYTGLLNLGHIAFFGIGAYTSTLLTMQGVPFIWSFLAAGLVAGITGYGLVFATRKLKGDYLALATLGFAFVTVSLLLNLTSLTRGPLGIPGIPKPELLGFGVKTNMQFFIFSLSIAALSALALWRIINTGFGRLLQATRDDELGLRVLGKDTFKLKAKAMVVSAFFAGIAGSLLAHYLSYIEPRTFYLGEIILLLTIVVLGGIASFKGTIIATIILIVIPELLRLIALPSSILGPFRQILYALILLGILLLRPRGLLGRVDLQ